MKNFPLLFCLVLLFAFGVAAQTNRDASCPTVDTSGVGVVKPGEPLFFTAHVEGYDSSKLSFNWTVSSGEILEGQGTVTIKVLKQKNRHEYITATVDVKGLPEICGVVTSSETEAVCSCIVLSVLLDEFGKLPNGELSARIDAYFVALGNEPGAQGYIINYGTKREIASREALFRNHIAFRKYDGGRITFVRGGVNPNGAAYFTKLWIVPAGAEPPTP